MRSSANAFRLVAPPGFAGMYDRIRQDLLQAAVRRAIAEARGQMVIRRFHLDGSALEGRWLAHCGSAMRLAAGKHGFRQARLVRHASFGHKHRVV